MIVKIKDPFTLFRRGELVFRFDVMAWFIACEKNGVDFDQIETIPDEVFLLSLLYGAYWSHQAHIDKRRKHNILYISKVYRWYYINNPGALQELQKAISESKIMGKSVAEWNQAGEKKKVSQ